MTKKIKFLIIIGTFFIVFLITINPILSYSGTKLIPKIIKNNIGRNVSLSKFKINIFTGVLSLNDFKIYEKNTKDIFFFINSLNFNLSLKKILKKSIFIHEIIIDTPSLNIVSDNNIFNFDDILKKIDSKEKNKSNNKKKRFTFTLKKFEIIKPLITFSDNKNLDIKYTIDSFKISDLNLSDNITFSSKIFDENFIDLLSNYSIKNNILNIVIDLDKLELNELFPIFKNFLNISLLKGSLKSKLNIQVNLLNNNIDFSGIISLDKFNIEDLNNQSLIFLNNITLLIDKSSLNEFNINEINLNDLNVNFKLFKDNKHNFSNLLKYVTEPNNNKKSKEVLDYNINTISLKNTNINFTDKSNEEEFRCSFENMDIKLNNILSSQSNLNFEVFSNINTSSSSINISGNISQPKKIIGDINLTLNNINFNDFDPIIKRFLNIRTINGSLSLNKNLKFEISDNPEFNLSGKLSVNNLSLIDNKSINIFNIKNLDVDIKSFNNLDNKLDINSIKIIDPKIIFYNYLKGNALTFLIKTNEIELKNNQENSINTSSKSAININLNELSINKGFIRYEDFTIKNNFNFFIDNIDLFINNFSNYNNLLSHIKLSSLINGKSNLFTEGDFILNKNLELDIKSKVENLNLIDFKNIIDANSPVEINKGFVDYNGKFSLKDNQISSNNNISLKTLEIGKEKEKVFDVKLPLNLIITILENTNNEIILDIPIKGNVKSPDFKISKIIFKTLKNIIVNTATSPLKILKKVAGVKEDVDTLKLEIYDKSLDSEIKKIESLAKILSSKDKINLVLNETYNEEMLYKKTSLFLIKKMYYNSLSIDPNNSSIEINKINSLDENFINFINTMVTEDNLSKTVDEKSEIILGKEIIIIKLNQSINQLREKLINKFVEKDIKRGRILINTLNNSNDSNNFNDNILYKVKINIK